MRQILLGLALIAALGILAVAAPQPGAAPLSVAMRVDTTAADPAAVLEFENLSGKPVAAYAVRLIRRAEDGKVASITTHAVSTRGLGMSLGRQSFQPGEKWTDAVKLPERQPVEAQLDLVLFEDGTHWGPNKAKQLERFQGMREGAHFEREAAKRQR
jgi:hypothetical protein